MMIKINQSIPIVAMVVTLFVAKAESSDGFEGKVQENIGKAKGRIVRSIEIKSFHQSQVSIKCQVEW